MIYAHSEVPPRQRSARNDASMRDGDSGHGNPGDSAGDLFEVDSDTDIGDTNTFEPKIDEDEQLSGSTPESLREFRELRDEVTDNNLYSQDAAVDATILSAEQEALGDTKEDDGGVVQPTELSATEAEESAAVVPKAEPNPSSAEPMGNYASMTVKAITERAREMSPAEVMRVLDFEKANRNRKSLVTQLERIASGRTRKPKEAAAE